MKIKALVVDDEAPARSELIYLINKIGGIEVCGEANSAEDAIKKFEKLNPHLVFLDIQMKPKNGITLAKELLKKENPPYIIFATAYDKYAIEAFEINAIDYILKPFSEERIKTTVERVKGEIEKSSNNNKVKDISDMLEKFMVTKSYSKIPVWKDDRIILLDPQDIIFVVTSQGKKTVFKTIEGEYETNYTLGEMEEKLSNDIFFKPHRSFIINLNYIKEIQPWFHNTYQLVMKNYEKEKIPVSRNQVKEFKKIINLQR